MSNPDKPEWLVPISRVVHHAIQPGAIRVKADTAAEALLIAADLVESRDGMDREEWEPVSEIQDASSPEIADDLNESDVLPVDDTPRPLRSRYPNVQVTLSRGAAEALMTLATEYLIKGGDVPQIHDPADVAAAQHFLTLGLRDDETIRALREPCQAEITVSLDCVTSIAALLTLELLVMSHIPHPGYPGHELSVQHLREFGNLLRPGQRIVIGAEPLKAEAGQ